MTTQRLTLPAPAKLNLFLHIVGRREDGYHLLETVFQFIDLQDRLTFEPNTTGVITFSCDDPALDGPTNLVIRAAQALQTAFAVELGCAIHLEKHIPYGAGLGGGSSDAATTLLALNQLWGLNLPLSTLATLGLTLGADVPVFVHGQAAFAQGIGEQLTPIPLETPWYVVLKPPVESVTRDIFNHPDLPRNTSRLPKPVLPGNPRNDFQALVCANAPSVARAIAWLSTYAPARLTGSGSAVFAGFETQQEATRVLAASPPEFQGWVVQGLNISTLHKAIKTL